MERQAVDQTTEAYWTDYFKEYGKAWVRKIPRRVASAIAAEVKRTAKAGEVTAPPLVRANIAPLGWAKSPTGGLIFEGIFRGSAADTRRVHRAFRAEFDPAGALIALRNVSVSA